MLFGIGLFVAIVCFAMNSLIARAALLGGHIDPLSFTAIRIISGACTLFPIVLIKFDRSKISLRRNLLGSSFLGLYAFFFSWAYINLNTGLGAMILFASVQVSMFGVSWFRGGHFYKQDYIGTLIALLGLGILFLPGNSGVNIMYSVIMVISGVAWGLYSLIGAESKEPVFDGALSFLFLFPLALLLFVFLDRDYNVKGVILAILSGSITSGLAYSLWYFVVSKIKVSTSAIIQTTVPIIATVMGVFVLDESLSLRFILASICVVLGIGVKSFPYASWVKHKTS